MPQGFNGAFNKAASIIEGNNRNTFGQARCDISELFLHALDHLHGILARAHDHDSAHDFAAIDIQRASAEIASDRDSAISSK